MHQSKWIRVARLTFLSSAVAFVLLPLFWLALGSLKSRDDALALPPKVVFTPSLTAYEKIIDGGFLGAFWNSLSIASTNVVLVLLIGTPAAYALARMRGTVQENLSFWILSIRMAPLFSIILPLWVSFRSLGLLDTPFAVALAHLTITLPLAVWLLITYFRNLPQDLDEAAVLDGARHWQILLYVIVPISRPMLASVAIIVFILSWNEFLLAFVLAGRNAQTVPLIVAGLAGTMNFDWPLIAAVSVGSMIPALLFVGFAQRHIVVGLSSGAIK